MHCPPPPNFLRAAPPGDQSPTSRRNRAPPATPWRPSTAQVAAQIDAFLLLLRACLRLERPWTLQIRDPTGNSFIENPRAPHPDPHCTVARFQRSAEDDRALGLSAAVQEERAAPPGARTPVPAPDYNTRRTDQEQRQVDDGRVGVGGSLAEVCYACKREGVVNLAMVDIPHFKETVILSFVCEHCGFRSNEVKSGGAVPDTGTEIRLDVREAVDLSRDVLKSDTCTVQVRGPPLRSARTSLAWGTRWLPRGGEGAAGMH